MSLLAGLSQQGDSIAAHNSDAAAHATQIAAQVAAHDKKLFPHGVVPMFDLSEQTTATITYRAWDNRLPEHTKVYSFTSATQPPSFVTPVGGVWRIDPRGVNGWVVSTRTHPPSGEHYTPSAGVSFWTDAPSFDLFLQFLSGGSSSRGNGQIQVKIDEVINPIATHVFEWGYDSQHLTVVFDTRKMRRIEIISADTIVFQEIATDAASIFTPDVPARRMLCIGDSTMSGEGVPDNKYMLAHVVKLGRALGYEVVNCAQSGTGYLTPYNDFPAYRAGYLADIRPKFPTADVYIVGGGFNDYNATSQNGTLEELSAEALLLWQQLRADSPAALIIGSDPVGRPAEANVNALTTALRAKFAAWGDANSVWLPYRDYLTADNWGLYSDDTVHPNLAGYDMLTSISYALLARSGK